MRRYLLPATVACLAMGVLELTWTARAADKPVPPPSPAAPACSTHHCPPPPDHCEPPCGVRKCCEPTVEERKHRMRNYAVKKEDFCVPKCSLWDILFNKCGKHDKCDAPGCEHNCTGGECACHKCGKVRQRKILLKQFEDEIECVPACRVEYHMNEPCCPPVHAEPADSVTPPAAPVKTLPDKLKGAELIPPPQKDRDKE
jgi:hypothetical protein